MQGGYEVLQPLCLTKPFPGPPVWLLYCIEFDLWKHQQPLEQVCCATFWLADDVEVWQAAQPEQFAVFVMYMLREASPHVIADALEALGAQAEAVALVRV